MTLELANLTINAFTLKNVKADGWKDDENVLVKLIFEKLLTVAETSDLLENSTPVLRKKMKLEFKGVNDFTRTIEIGEMESFATATTEDADVKVRTTFSTISHIDELPNLFGDFLPMRYTEMSFDGRLLSQQQELFGKAKAA